MPAAEKAPSRASEVRRSTKPIMEKRRRARINNSLTELKNLILDALKKDNARHSKLEKADILEMTVKHLQSLQRHTAPEPLSKYRAGFSECAGEVSRYLVREGVDPVVQQRLMSHLSTCLSKPVHQPVHVQVPASGPVNLSSHKEQPSLQVVNATRLPSGGLAFLLPPGSPYSSTDSSSSSCLSPVSLLGSSGILSPAASDRSTPSPITSCGQYMTPMTCEPVWRPW